MISCRILLITNRHIQYYAKWWNRPSVLNIMIAHPQALHKEDSKAHGLHFVIRHLYHTCQ